MENILGDNVGKVNGEETTQSSQTNQKVTLDSLTAWMKKKNGEITAEYRAMLAKPANELEQQKAKFYLAMMGNRKFEEGKEVLRMFNSSQSVKESEREFYNDLTVWVQYEINPVEDFSDSSVKDLMFADETLRGYENLVSLMMIDIHNESNTVPDQEKVMVGAGEVRREVDASLEISDEIIDALAEVTFNFDCIDRIGVAMGIADINNDFMCGMSLSKEVKNLNMETAREYIQIYLEAPKAVQQINVFKFLTAQGLAKDLQDYVSANIEELIMYLKPLTTTINKIRRDDNIYAFCQENKDPISWSTFEKATVDYIGKTAYKEFIKEQAYGLVGRADKPVEDVVLDVLQTAGLIARYIDGVVQTMGVTDMAGMLKESKQLAEFADESPKARARLQENMRKMTGTQSNGELREKSRLDADWSEEDERQREAQVSEMSQAQWGNPRMDIGGQPEYDPRYFTLTETDLGPVQIPIGFEEYEKELKFMLETVKKNLTKVRYELLEAEIKLGSMDMLKKENAKLKTQVEYEKDQYMKYARFHQEMVRANYPKQLKELQERFDKFKETAIGGEEYKKMKKRMENLLNDNKLLLQDVTELTKEVNDFNRAGAGTLMKKAFNALLDGKGFK